MGKLLCDSTSVAEPFQGSPPAALPWREPKPEPIGTVDLVVPANVGGAPFAGGGWEDVVGLEEQQRRHLQRLHAKGVLWKPPPEEEDSSSPLSSSALRSVVFRLSHGGEVSADGNCLFTASRKAMGGEDVDARELRRRTVARFLEDLGSVSFEEREAIDNAIRHMYSPDLKNGWGIHVVQEVKLLAKKEDRFALDSAIEELVHLGMQREMAAESIYKERCVSVNDGPSWAKYI
uniref:OTU domain-containing protein n=1 Tax=Glycine max TaxID=3847 RepID=A0A0R0F5Q1_SOYBN